MPDGHAIDFCAAGWANAIRTTTGAVSRQTPSFKGKTRLVKVCDEFLRRWASPAESLGITVAGVRFVVDTTDWNDFNVMYGLDANVSEYLARVIGSRELVVWDVGANVGAVTLMLAARCPRARLVAIEASPSVGRRLERNLAANPELATRVQYLALALSDESGETAFYESAEAFNSGVGRLRPATNTVSSPSTVAMFRGDDVIARGLAPAPDVVKMDIEGFEYQALRGMSSCLTSRSCHVVFEHEPYRLETPNNPPSPFNLLQELGYSIWTLEEKTLGASVVSHLPQGHCDLVALKSASC